MKILVNYSLPELLKIGKAKLNDMLRREYATAATTWHKRYRKQHFQMKAYGLYGYATRSPKYNRRKHWKLKHQLPLVFTGRTRAGSEWSRVEATARFGRAIYPSVQALNYQPRGFTGNMRREFETVAASEEHAIAQQFETGLTRQLQASAARK